ncbi:MAG: hypothetical protein QW228_06310 [Candidatus Aenigmatarchaeota archaeon]
MLSIATINNEEVTVYTVPTGKTAMVQLYVFLPNDSNITVKINNTVYYSAPSASWFSEKLVLNAGDTITISSDGQANVFVNGMEV